MYINPETNIRILRNVPLDTTYEHTIFFASKDAQTSYFMGLQKHNLTNYTYQRVGKGVARVGIKAEDLYDCNYMMFQNTSFGNKWFYAYITSVEYINNITSEIRFEIDVMQTWFFDHTPDYCFVEREHVIDDVIGAHIEPEGVDCGEYIMNTYSAPFNLTDMSVVIAIVDVEEETVSGKNYDGVYGGATLYAYDLSQTDDINALLAEYHQKPDAVQTIYMCPSSFLDFKTGKLPSGMYGTVIVQDDTPISVGIPLDGYIPKNNKLYTYPYSFYHVDNGSGATLVLRYEFFEGLKPQLRISSTVTQPVAAIVYPYKYKVGSGASSDIYKAESLQINSFAMCSWNTDAYKAWVAQNTVPTAINAVTSMASAPLTAILTGNALAGVTGLVSSGVSQAGSILSQNYTASIAADISKGSLNNGGVNAAHGENTFLSGRASITGEYARSIDEYFTKFGYAVRRLKIPNRSARPHWNFVKTVGCTLTGSVPADDMKKLCAIYDMGVTFWKNGSEVGNYGLDNRMEGA